MRMTKTGVMQPSFHAAHFIQALVLFLRQLYIREHKALLLVASVCSSKQYSLNNEFQKYVRVILHLGGGGDINQCLNKMKPLGSFSCPTNVHAVSPVIDEG